ncbi:MAG: sulfatase family protein [Thalassotalea sp.]
MRINTLLLTLIKTLTLVLFSLVNWVCIAEKFDSNRVNKTPLNDERPNIIFIYTDDQAPWALGHSGNAQALTPNLDKLASEGMYLPNSYTTTPVCSPSRAGLLTSQYSYEIGIDDWINVNPKAKTLTGHQPKLGLSPELETWPKILQNSGYFTGLIGKWHLGTLDKFHPTKHGYDQFFGFRAGGNSPKNPTLEVYGKEQRHEGLTVDILTDYGVNFIRENKANKFVLSLHYRAPHYKFLPVAPEDAAPYLTMDIKLPHPNYPDLNIEQARQYMREYLSSVRGIDRNVGKLMAELTKQSLTDNTLVVFTSDHGYNIGHNGMWHKGNGFSLLNTMPIGTKNVPGSQRPNMYNNSIKVPTIVRWPKVIKANSTNYSTMSNLDWFPTLISIANGNVSKNNIVRGVDYLPVFLNPHKIISSDYYAAYSTLHQSLTDMRMYSDGNYKLVRDFKNPERAEFYNLLADPAETTNLINSRSLDHTTIMRKFDQIIKDKMISTNDPILINL